MLTTAQALHLQNCEDPDREFKATRAGYNCRVKGLSEWLWLMSDGTLATQAEVSKMAKPLPDERRLKTVKSEVLTDAGRRALAKYRREAT